MTLSVRILKSIWSFYFINIIYKYKNKYNNFMVRREHIQPKRTSSILSYGDYFHII